MLSSNNSSVFHRLPRQDYPIFVRGAGSRLFDSTGKMYIDAAGGGAGVTCIGHANRNVVDAIDRQHRELSYVCNMSYTNVQQERLASRLAAIAPSDLNRVYFVQDGTEANEAALRVTRQYHIDRGDAQRDVVIAQAFGYYGSTFGAMALSGLPPARFPVNDWLPKFERVVPARSSDACSLFFAAEPCVAGDVGNFNSIAERIGPERIAAVVTEVVVTAAGGLDQPDEYLVQLAEWCRRIGALLIVDEIVTGLGRTGRWFRSERAGIVPDLVTIGKSLGGGYAPISAVLVRKHLYDTIVSTSGRFAHGHSLSGNPVSCAAGNAILDVIGEERLVERSQRVGARIRKTLSEELATCGLLHEVRGEGMFIVLEFRYDDGRFIEFERRFASVLQGECLSDGLLVCSGSVHPSGLGGDHLILWPAFNMPESDVDEMITRLKSAITRALGALVRRSEPALS